MITRRWALFAATPAALAGLSLGTSGVGAGSSAGPRQPTQVLLCGTFMNGSDRAAGSSSIVHPSGSSSMGKIYQFHGQNCEQEENQNDSIGTYSWTVTVSTVHAEESGTQPQAEFGTEHGAAMLSTDGNQTAGFQGRITNFDLSMNDSDGDPCNAQGSNRSIFYASGNRDADNNCSPGGPGNFNTHGGAQDGDHFVAKYGSTVYQDEDMSNTASMCNASLGSSAMCFEAVIQGFTN
jgi:hypothetical protein